MIKIIRRWYWITSGFFKKHLTSIIIGLVVSLLIVAYQDFIFKLIPAKSTHRIARVGAYTLQNLPVDIQQKISRGLTQFDDKNTIIPDVASTISQSEDSLTYTVTLDPNAFWSTGDKLSAQDIEISIADVDMAVNSAESLTFTLKEPYSPFPSVLSQPLLKKITTGRFHKRTEIIGLNTYNITNITTQRDIIASLTLNSPDDTIIYSFYPTEEAAITAFKLGYVDAVEYLTHQSLENWSNVRIESQAQPNQYVALFFNTSNQDLQDKSIRQMLTYATPKKTNYLRVISPISKNSWAYNPQVKPYEYSQQAAVAILDRLTEANANFHLEIELTTTPGHATLGQSIIDSWEALGISAKLKIVSFPDTNDYQILLIGQQIPKDPDQYALWHSTQSTNITKYQNPKIDKLLEDGRQEADPEKRKLIYQDFQRFLVEDSPVAFLHNLEVYHLYRQ